MPANISKNTNGIINFVSRQYPAWWGKGNKIYSENEKVTLLQAVEDSQIGRYEMIDPYLIWNGEYIEGIKQKAVIRVQPDGKAIFLDFVGEDYPLIQNQTIAEIFDPISEVFPVETLGALGKGERVFFCLNGGNWEVTNKNGTDLMKTYVVISDNKVGTQATKVMMTPVRVVCQNTETLATQKANIRVNVWHKKDNIRILKSISDTILEIQNKQKEIEALFNNLASTPYNMEQFKELIIKKLYCKKDDSEENTYEATGGILEPEDMKAYVEAIKLEEHSELFHLFNKYNDENMAFANTKWNAWNTITEFEDWRIKRGPQSGISTLFGNAANKKAKALELLV